MTRKTFPYPSNRAWLLAVFAFSVMGCSQKEESAPKEASDASLAAGAVSTQPGRSTNAQALIPNLPEGFGLGGDCPDPGTTAGADIAAQASATIPLKKGLTLSSTWVGKAGDYDHECLTQISGVDTRGVDLTYSCPVGDTHENVTYGRRLCRVDLRDAYIYSTGFLNKALPDVLGGTTTFSFSEKSFGQLKNQGEMRHRYLQLDFSAKKNALFVRDDQVGVLKPKDTSQHSAYALDLFDTLDVIVNDRTVALPIINAWGTVLADGGSGSRDEVRTKVLDDPHFPLVLQYEQVGWHFSIKYTRISFPTDDEIEKALEKDKHVDVYGIYFDFGSDRLRPESEPVLREISEALQKNGGWTLRIQGHTDNVGSDAFNMDLSERRSAAVRTALIQRFAIDGTRLTTSGFGASQPKESNATVEGRAKNRRVELVRE
jgi:outer membrane protein OmpA-like peptidoglycan-associated protein